MEGVYCKPRMFGTVEQGVLSWGTRYKAVPIISLPDKSEI